MTPFLFCGEKLRPRFTASPARRFHAFKNFLTVIQTNRSVFKLNIKLRRLDIGADGNMAIA